MIERADNAQFAIWRDDPALFVREMFEVEPDKWQEEVLAAFPKAQRLAMKACKGPGKTAVEAWLAWNFLVTRTEPKIAATSITADNLFDNLWAEMAKWQQRAPYLREHFKWTKDRIVCKECPETWWMSARTWNRATDRTQQGNTLAGLHADHILFILDESGGIPDAVMATAEAALASCIEGHIVQAGNPTHLDGPLYRACTSERRLWHVTEITADPDDRRRSSRVKAEWAREQIEKYGRDNPWVLVNVFGKFPPGSLNTLIGPDECRAAMERRYPDADIVRAPRVLGVDVARFGDDASVIFPRQGLVALPPIKMRNADGLQGAGAVARRAADWKADAIFVDDTGGWGASWIDNLRTLGHVPIGVGFASRPNDPRYDNKRTEMYFELVQWIKNGGALPDVPELVAALSQTTYSFRGDRLLLEPKEQVKARLGYSPDDADALALTFAQPVAARQVFTDGAGYTYTLQDREPRYSGRVRRFCITNYDPLEDA
jgi:phage terminase large subunit